MVSRHEINTSNGELPAFEDKSIEKVIQEAEDVAIAALNDPYRFEKPIKHVAVIGAGASGLPTARALQDQGIEVTIFERSNTVGGNWAFSKHWQDFPQVPDSVNEELNFKRDSYPLPEVPEFLESSSPVLVTEEVQRYLANRHQPPTACYLDLFNNTRVPMLGSLTFPWPKGTPPFVPHTKVHRYYQDFAEHFNLTRWIRFNTVVDKMVKDSDAEHPWKLSLTEAVHSKDENNQPQIQFIKSEQSFDAVVLATGAHHDAFVPHLPGLAEFQIAFPDRVFHAKQFRDPHTYTGKRVLVVGHNVSGMDISRLVSRVADKVYLSFRGEFESPVRILRIVRDTLPDSVIKVPYIQRFGSLDGNGNAKADGTIQLVDGTVLDDVDVVIFATGYRSKMPFLGDMRTADPALATTPGKIVFGDMPSSITNTFKDVFVISDPTIAVVGFTSFIPSILSYDPQAYAVARVWSGNAFLPNVEQMVALPKQQGKPCAPYLYGGLAERRRAHSILGWLNYHANQLNPGLPVLQAPPEEQDALWEHSFVNWNEHILDQERQVNERRKHRLQDTSN
ncbi:FAD/NAD(P)-binding domain-containing protein [Hesseltinella vesiculosa]|uniref:FAD/NAD(P)-binding domain-containing protein n=1 Tax=Hesseltinella vesiculosa TaxID=101127 RepID=A0A1X2G2R3_9FUNG|nr:FAD/NAD(P)-binding domain-containing protein [Hesseltinella vesiculosa]